MAGYRNFQSDNAKYSTKISRTNVNNPAFNPAIQIDGKDKCTSFEKNLSKWVDVVSYYRWMPDLWWDLITPKTGGIRLDLDQRVFLRALARFPLGYYVFSRAYGKCVTADTLLFTDDGIKPIGELFGNNKCGYETYYNHNISLVDRNHNIQKSYRGIYSGKKPTVKIETNEGYAIEGTYVHPLLVKNEYGEYEYKKLKDIKIGDYVCLSIGDKCFGKRINIDKSKEMQEWLSEQNSILANPIMKGKDMPKEITKEFAYLLGVLVSDRKIKGSQIFGFSKFEKDIISSFCRNEKNSFGNISKKYKKHNKKNYAMYDKWLKVYFEKIGIKFEELVDKEIPNCIMQAPQEMVSKFISALFDIDGNCRKGIVYYTTVSPKLAKQIQILLLNFGIVSKMYKKYDSYGKYNIRIDIFDENISIFKNEIGFNNKRKQRKLEKLCLKKDNVKADIDLYSQQKDYEKNYFNSKVTQISYSINDVYDLEVEDTHSFVGNGFINHNTMLEVMGLIHTAVFYPRVKLALTAQSLKKASAILKAKYDDLTKFYPLIKEEIYSVKFSADYSMIEFHNGSTIDVLANSQTTKGERRHRGSIEEDNLVDEEVYTDAVKPVFDDPRRTLGKKGLIDPNENNSSINSFTTSGYRGSPAYNRCLRTFNGMMENDGSFCLGASWKLPAFFGRGKDINAILADKKKMSPFVFDMNYMSHWTGSGDDGICNIVKLLECRNLDTPELSKSKTSKVILSVDVAQSDKDGNCQTVVEVLEVMFYSNGRVKEIRVPQIISIDGKLNFTAQAIEIKRIKKKYNAIIIVVDNNGLGRGKREQCPSYNASCM